MDKMESSLIAAEKLDNILKFKIFGPKLATKKDSEYANDRLLADSVSKLEFLVFRGAFIGIDRDKTFFNLALVFSDLQINPRKIKSLYNEAGKIKVNDELKSQIDLINEKRNELLELVESIKIIALKC